MKRMLEVVGDTFKINASSAEIIHTCRRKAFYALNRNLRSEEGSEALVFGKAIHRALELFYSTSPDRRSLEQVQWAFMDAAAPYLSAVPSSDKRSIENGKKILEKYFNVYSNDPWMVVIHDKKPMVEFPFEIKVNEKMTIHGQIDCLLQNMETDEIVVCDHKTSSSLGSDFMSRIKPNMQFSAYAWAANKLGFDVQNVMVNGIQVAKTKTDLLRVFTKRNEADFREMFESFDEACSMFLRAKQANSWPMNSASCSHYGGCPYRDICSLDVQYRETAIEQVWGKKI